MLRGQGGQTKPDQTMIASEVGLAVTTVSRIWSKHFAAHYHVKPTLSPEPLPEAEDDFETLAKRARAIIAHRLRIEERRIVQMEQMIADEVAMSTINRTIGPSQTRELKDLAVTAGILADKAAAFQADQPLAVLAPHPSDLTEGPTDGDYPPPPDNVVPLKAGSDG